MAVSSQTLNYDTVRSLVQDTINTDVVDNIFESSSLLSLLLGDGKVNSAEGRLSQGVNGGLNILQPVQYAKGNVETFEKYDIVDTTPVDDVTNAIHPFTKRYSASISISQSELLAVNGDKAIKNLLAHKTEAARETLKDGIAKDLYSGSTAIVGLDSAIAQGTYANIAGGTLSLN